MQHLLRYAARVRAEPAASLVAGIDYSSGYELPAGVELTGRRLLVAAVFVGGIVVLVYGIAAWGWYLTELSAVFLAIGLLAALAGGLGPNAAARAFLGGAAAMTTTALLIGFARTIQVVLSDAQVIDTVIHGLAGPLAALPGHAAAVGMLAVQTVCNFFIPSGSGQAFVTMPIMAPLARPDRPDAPRPRCWPTSSATASRT